MLDTAVATYLFLVCLLPAAAVLGVNIKLIATIIMAVLFIVLYDKRKIIDGNILSWFVVSACFLFFFSIVSFIRGVNIIEYTSHIVPLVLFVFYTFLMNRVINRAGIEFLLKVLTGILITLALLKVVVYILDYLGIFSAKEYILLIKLIFNYDVITLDTEIGTRLHQPSDYLFLLYPLILNCQDKLKKINNHRLFVMFKFVALFVIFSAILISYSRSLWFFFTLIMLVYLIDYNKKIIFVLPFISLIVLSVGGVSDFIISRYSGEYAGESDMERYIMYERMVQSISDSPIFGLGIGGYIINYVRFEDLKWNYELQVLSLIVNFGLIGFICLVVIFAFYLYNNRKSYFYSKTYVAVFASWLIINFFNCFAFTSFGAVIFGFLFGLISKTNKNFIGRS